VGTGAIRYTVFECAQKLTNSQLNLSHGTKQKRVMKKLKTKHRYAYKKRSGHKVCGVSPEAKESWWEGFVKEVGHEPKVKKRELWMVRVVR